MQNASSQNKEVVSSKKIVTLQKDSLLSLFVQDESKRKIVFIGQS